MPDIRQSAGIVTQITTVKMRPDNQDEVLKLMKERARFMARQPGFVSVSLHRSADGSHVVNYVQWADKERLAAAHHSPEFRKGFLLNHLISELLPPDGGYSYANADPITGQAAWYDLRVRIDRAAPAEAGIAAPSFEIPGHPAWLGNPPAILRYFAGTDREEAAQ